MATPAPPDDELVDRTTKAALEEKAKLRRSRSVPVPSVAPAVP